MTTIKLYFDAKETTVTTSDGYYHTELNTLFEPSSLRNLLAQFRLIKIGFDDRLDALLSELYNDFTYTFTQQSEKQITSLLKNGIALANAIDEKHFLDDSKDIVDFRDVLSEMLNHNDPDIKSLSLSLYSGIDFWDCM
jgi:hypothetical protein